MSLLDITLNDLITELYGNKAKLESLKELTDKLVKDIEDKDRQIEVLDRRIKDLAMRLAELSEVEVQPSVIHIHYDRPAPCPTFPTNPWYDPYRPYCTSSSTSNADNLAKTTATTATGGVVSDKVASNFVKSPVKVEDIIGRADLSDMSNPRDPYGVEQKERDELIKSIILAMAGGKHE